MSPTRTQPPRIASLRVADAMHSGVVACERETPLPDVAATMAREGIHCVVVENGSGDGGEPWGVVSDLDLVAAATVRALEQQTAAGTVATPVVLVSPEASLERAAHLMTEHGTSHLIVVNLATGSPVGVLSTIDIAAALTAENDR